MLCCITFLATSLTTEASSNSPDITYTFSNTVNLRYANGHYIPDIYYHEYSSSSPKYWGDVREYGESFNVDLTMPVYIQTLDQNIVNQFSTSKYYYVTIFSGVDIDYTYTNGQAYSSANVNTKYLTVSGSDKTFPVGSPVGQSRGSFYISGSDLISYLNETSNLVRIYGLLHTNFFVLSSGTRTNYADIRINQSYNAQFKEVSKSVYDSNVGNKVTDSGTQNAINNQTEKVEQGNDIAQENADTNKDTNNKITDFFNGFFENLVHIFVPEDGFFSQWFNSLNDFMAQKLGFLWSPFDFMLSFLNGVYNGSGSASLVFPELAWIDGTVIIPRTEFSFDNIGGQSFQDLRDMIYFATDVILLGAVISQFYKKIKLVFEGGGD